MKTLRYTFLLVAILVTVATAENRSAPNPQELDIAETVFRYQMAQPTDYSIGTNATAFYLDFKDSDPPAELLKRFTLHSPPVKARSDVDNNETMAVRDSHTKKLGVLLNIQSIERTSNTEARVSAGHYENGKSASHYVYELEKTEGQWKVVRRRLVWIS